MTQGAVVQREEKTVSLWQFLLIVFLTMGVLISSGMFVGKKFFWVGADIVRAKQEISQYEQMLKNDPKNLETRVALGYRYSVIGKHEDALTMLQTAVDMDKNYFPAYLNLGYVYFDLEKYDEALENFDQCTKLAPNDYLGFLNLGVTYYKLGKIEKAYDALNTARTKNPGSADIHYHLGVASELNGDTELAIEQYEEALSYDPQYEDAKKALKRLTRG